jgi:arylsulfatase A-like enzyme
MTILRKKGVLNMNRRNFLKVAGFFGSGLSCSSFLGACREKTKHKRTNLLFIICDDLNDSIEQMGGHPQAKTPNIDKLAEMGTRFMNAQSNAPLCGPSRASLLCGLYPHTTGYFGYNQNFTFNWRLNERMKNSIKMPQYFVQNGYEVMAAGKTSHPNILDRDLWRNADGKINYPIALDYGPWPYDGKSENPLPHPNLPSPLNLRECMYDGFGPLSNKPVFTDDKGNPCIGGWRNFTGRLSDPRNQDYFKSIGQPAVFPEMVSEFKYKTDDDRDLMHDERVANWAIKEFEKQRDKPFFMTLGFAKPHSPLYAPKKYFDLFDAENIQLPPYLENDLDDCAKVLVEKTNPDDLGREIFEAVQKAGGKGIWRQWIHAYLACVAFVDDQVGKVIDGLAANGLLDNTIIIFCSDNGYHLGEKDHLFKNTLWEESTRIPLIVAAPGLTGGESCDHPVSLVDIYPSMIELCGLPKIENLDGYSLQAFLENPKTKDWAGPDAALSVVAGNDKLGFNEPGKPDRQHYSIRTKEWRYTLCYDGEEELYDHEPDPNEWKNLAREKAYESIKKELKHKLLHMTGREQ